MRSPNRIAASTDGPEWLRCIIYFVLDYFANVLCFFVEFFFSSHDSIIRSILHLLMFNA